MSDASQSKRTPIKDRTLIAADDELIERAYKAMQEKIYTKAELAKITELSRSTINRFFQKQEIRPDSYNQICKTLLLNEKIVIQKEKTAFTITGRIDKKLTGELKVIIDVLKTLTDGDIYYSGIEIE